MVRRVAIILYALATALSLLLLLASAVAWAWGVVRPRGWETRHLFFGTTDGRLRVAGQLSHGGSLRLGAGEWGYLVEDSWSFGGRWLKAERLPVVAKQIRLPDGSYPPTDAPPITVRTSTVYSADGDAWAFCLLFAVLPTAELLRRHCSATRRLRDAGRCAGCGYDLRATPDCCPECGLFRRREPLDVEPRPTDERLQY